MSGEMIAIVTVTLVGVFLTSLKRTIQSFRRNCLRELGKIKTVQLVGMAVTPLLVTALLAACTEQPTSPISTHRAEPSK